MAVPQGSSNNRTELLLTLKHSNMVGYSLLFRSNFSTFFIKDKFTMKYEDLDCPDPTLPEDLEVEIRFNVIDDEEKRKENE